MQTAQTPTEVSCVSATQASLEMEQHALILMSVHKIHTTVTIMQTAPTSMEVSRVSATQASMEME